MAIAKFPAKPRVRRSANSSRSPCFIMRMIIVFLSRLMEKPEEFDVIVVGADAAGIGIGVMLKDLGLENFAILERHQIGESF